jgi:hypothetical protein
MFDAGCASNNSSSILTCTEYFEADVFAGTKKTELDRIGFVQWLIFCPGFDSSSLMLSGSFKSRMLDFDLVVAFCNDTR